MKYSIIFQIFSPFQKPIFYKIKLNSKFIWISKNHHILQDICILN